MCRCVCLCVGVWQGDSFVYSDVAECCCVCGVFLVYLLTRHFIGVFVDSAFSHSVCHIVYTIVVTTSFSQSVVLVSCLCVCGGWVCVFVCLCVCVCVCEI